MQVGVRGIYLRDLIRPEKFMMGVPSAEFNSGMLEGKQIKWFNFFNENGEYTGQVLIKVRFRPLPTNLSSKKIESPKTSYLRDSNQ